MTQAMWAMLAVGAGLILLQSSRKGEGLFSGAITGRASGGAAPGPALLDLAPATLLDLAPAPAFMEGVGSGFGGALVDVVEAPSFEQTADEDIGFAPAPEVAAAGFNQVAEAAAIPAAITVASSSAPVISQAPKRVEVTLISPEKSIAGTYALGVPEGVQLTGATDILIRDFAGEGTGLGEDLSTTPTVLGAYLAGFDTVAAWQESLAA